MLVQIVTGEQMVRTIIVIPIIVSPKIYGVIVENAGLRKLRQIADIRLVSQ